LEPPLSFSVHSPIRHSHRCEGQRALQRGSLLTCGSSGFLDPETCNSALLCDLLGVLSSLDRTMTAARGEEDDDDDDNRRGGFLRLPSLVNIPSEIVEMIYSPFFFFFLFSINLS
jgi:hypothetical protein